MPRRKGPSFPPPDVAAFIARRNDCDLWRDMSTFDDASRELRRQRMEHHCPGTDEELVRLQDLYARNSRVMDLLSRYETYPSHEGDTP